MNQELVKQLREFPGAHLGAGASPGEIEAIERAAGLRLPNELRDFYQTCNGVTFNEGGLEFFNVAAAEGFRRAVSEHGINRSWQYWPLDNNSNPICVCCSGPLSGYVVQVFHDDSAKIKWRNFEGFLKATLDSFAEEEWAIEFIQHDFNRADRTVKDIEVARGLLNKAGEMPVGNLERGDLCRFAAWLLGDEQWEEIEKLLETEDEYVRREIENRLKAIRLPEARRALSANAKKVQDFVRMCSELLVTNGLRTNVVKNSQLQVLDGSLWLNMDQFYNERSRPDFQQFFVDRVKHLVAQNQKQ
jgi:hypothetical protein